MSFSVRSTAPPNENERVAPGTLSLPVVEAIVKPSHSASKKLSMIGEIAEERKKQRNLERQRESSTEQESGRPARTLQAGRDSALVRHGAVGVAAGALERAGGASDDRVEDGAVLKRDSRAGGDERGRKSERDKGEGTGEHLERREGEG
jgi:hypothetical protein